MVIVSLTISEILAAISALEKARKSDIQARMALVKLSKYLSKTKTGRKFTRLRK